METLAGFNHLFLGWGLEDVYLATNVINHNINVFRSVEPELVHLFHHKHCDPKLSPQQLDGCVKEQFQKIVVLSPTKLANLLHST